MVKLGLAGIAWDVDIETAMKENGDVPMDKVKSGEQRQRTTTK